MFLVASATGVVGVLVEYKFVELASGTIANLGLGRYSLPFVAAVMVGLGTNFMSGLAATALFGGILTQQNRTQPRVHGHAGSEPRGWLCVAVGRYFDRACLRDRQARRQGDGEGRDRGDAGYSVLVAALHILLSPFV